MNSLDIARVFEDHGAYSLKIFRRPKATWDGKWIVNMAFGWGEKDVLWTGEGMSLEEAVGDAVTKNQKAKGRRTAKVQTAPAIPADEDDLI
jgi:hypothetical protein